MTARRLLLALGGAAIACVGAVCGIGGGLFAVPLLHYGFGLTLRRAVATSLSLVFVASVTATSTELLHPDGALLWNVVLPLAGSALVGAQFGYIVSKRLDERALKTLFALVLAGVGVKLALGERFDAAPAEFAEALAGAEIATIVAIGLLAGTIAPLLGIGGGLFVVPGLLMGVPDVGNLGARAASLAMAVVTSARSLHLYASEGSVELGIVPWFAGGALAGAIAGVQLVHLPGIAGVGQIVLGAILVFTAARFAFDVLRSGRTEAAS